MQIFDARVLYHPPSSELRFLPEGPYPFEPGLISWVAIQHGANATSGSLNLLLLDGSNNRSIALNGRPGFAFPSTDPEVFLVGLERRIEAVNIETGECQAVCDEVESDVEGTIINDAVAFTEGIVFGCKDLQFAEAKAGLYLWRSRDRSIVRLKDDQICSNGKVLRADADGWSLLDIDTPTKKIVRYRLNVESGQLSEGETVLDLTAESMFPDGMIETPDGGSVIIAFYNPEDAEFGVARQYSLTDQTLEAEWRCQGSPQVTCPQLVESEGQVKLILTTAVEHMTPERQAQHPNAGAVFVAETPFQSLPSTPRPKLLSV